MDHLYTLGNSGVLSSVFIGDLHGNTDRGKPRDYRGRNRVNGETGSHFHHGSGGNGDSCLEISTDYRGETAIMGTKHCVRGGNGDDFLSPCSSSLY